MRRWCRNYSPLQLEEQVPMVSIQLLLKILLSQQESGAWGRHLRSNSVRHSLVIVISLLALDSPNRHRLHCRRYGARKAVPPQIEIRGPRVSYIWTRRVTYASDVLSEAYCLAAALVPIPSALPLECPVACPFFRLPDSILRGIRRRWNSPRRSPASGHPGFPTFSSPTPAPRRTTP